MKTINIVARWTHDKKQTWSGIVWGLYTSLSNHYNVVDIDISVVKRPLYYRFIRFLSKKFGFKYNDICLSLISETKKYLVKKGANQGVYLQFDESITDDKLKKTYIFIDESVDHALYLRDSQPETFEKSNFAQTNIRYLERRRKQQNEYFMNCAGIFTLCHWLVDDLVKRTGIPAHKVHYGGSGINVDFDKIDDTLKDGNKILFVGKDFERKGGYHIIDAFKELLKKMPNAELYVAGPQLNPIEEEIPGYHFLGLCNRDQLNNLYNKCDVFAMPSYFEAFGIVFVEALTFGLPCLVRNNQDMPYIIDHGKTGYVIDKDDTKVTAEYLFKMLTDESFKQNVISKRPYYKEYYSWDTVAMRIKDVIK